MFKKLFSIAALSAIATVAYAGSAQAANFSYSSGIFRDSNVTNEGTFSENVNKPGYEVFDFNDSTSLPGNDKIKYSFEGTNKKTQVVPLGHDEMQWAPAGVNGEVNETQYLQVFKGKTVLLSKQSKKAILLTTSV